MIKQATGILFLLISALLFRCADVVTGVASSTTACAAMLALGLLVTIVALTDRRMSLRKSLFAVGVFAVFAAGIMATVNSDDPLDRFHRVYWRIQPGMTRAEVEEVVRLYFPGEKPPARWSERGGGYCLGTRIGGQGDANCIQISLENGRVVQAEFLPD